MDSDYWNSLYLAGDTNWDKCFPSPVVKRLLQEGVVPARASIAVIGAGRGHGAIEAARQGFK
jgi:hypothetical protein